MGSGDASAETVHPPRRKQLKGHPVTAGEPWICPTCTSPRDSAFCPACGEQPLRARHLSLRDLGSQLFTAISSIDGKLLRSLRWLVARPGYLTLAYVEGRRKPFFGPLQLFLIANGLFFAVQSASHASIFASPLASHMHQQDWAELAQRIVAGKLEAKGVTLAAYAPLFNQAAAVNAKALIILMTLVFAAMPPLVFPRSRRPFAAHVVFALHTYAFLLLLFCVSLGISSASLALGGPGLENPGVDTTLSLFNLAACGAYLWIATGEVYAARGWLRIVQTAALAVSVAALVLAYRFAIFVITLWGT
jgi:hypothetical protein